MPLHYQRPITDIITSRTSRRKYRGGQIADGPQRVIRDFLASRPHGPFGSGARFELVTASEGDGNALRGLGTYGFISRAPGFIIGATKSSPKDLEDYGFVMEQIILLATDLGLGTCWLGGSFTRSSFSAKIGARDDELVPAVAAIGEATERRGAVERVIRWGAGSRNRLPWEVLFFAEGFHRPLMQRDAGELAIPLQMVRLAPSASNKQPWRLILQSGGETVHFFMKRSAGYDRSSRLMAMADLQRIDMGIAMCHFAATLEGVRAAGRWIVEAPALDMVPDRTEYVATYTFERG